MKNLFLVILFLFITISLKAQKVGDTALSDKLSYYNTCYIYIHHYYERNESSESALIYLWVIGKIGKYKIHSVVKESGACIDTVFTLNGYQINFIDSFEKQIRDKSLGSKDTKYAGDHSTYSIIIDNKAELLTGGMDFSLLEKLVKIK